MGYDPAREFPFLLRQIPRIDENKHKLQLTLFGSYCLEPLGRLETLRDVLRAHGYRRSNLVQDYPIPTKDQKESDEEWFESRSNFWINHSDVLLFVFFMNADNAGVSSEFTQFCQNLDRHWRGVVFIEVDDYSNLYPISSMISGRIQRYKIQCYQFMRNNDQLLHDMALGPLTSFMKILLNELHSRP